MKLALSFKSFLQYEASHKASFYAHEYANQAEVRMTSEYMIRRASPATGIKCQEVVNIFAEASAVRGQGNDDYFDVKKLIGAEVVGMTA